MHPKLPATVDYEFISTKQVFSFAVCPYGLATDVSSLDPAQVLHGLEDLEGRAARFSVPIKGKDALSSVPERQSGNKDGKSKIRCFPRHPLSRAYTADPHFEPNGATAFTGCCQRCTTLALMPCDIATLATDAPGASHSAITCACISAL